MEARALWIVRGWGNKFCRTRDPNVVPRWLGQGPGGMGKSAVVGPEAGHIWYRTEKGQVLMKLPLTAPRKPAQPHLGASEQTEKGPGYDAD